MPSPEDRVDGGIAAKLEFEPVERKRSGRRWGRLVGFLVLVGVASGGAWVLWGKQFIEAGQQNDLPIVRAESAPIKVKPADPGGMDVPDRDKLVYNRLNGEGAGEEVERLLPPPEEPLPLPESGVSEEMAAAEETAGATEPVEPAPESAPTALEPMALEPETVATIEATPPAPPAPPAETATTTEISATSEPPSAPEPATEPPSSEPAAADTAPASSLETPQAPEPETSVAAAQPAVDTSRLPTSDTYRIQLAALRSQDRAEAEWDRLRTAHTDLLGRLGLSIVRVDLGADKGVFYRLRAGPLADATAAKSLCERLSARNVGCLVVRPGS